MKTEKIIPTIHIEGILKYDGDWISVKDICGGSLAQIIQYRIEEAMPDRKLPVSKEDPANPNHDNEYAEASMFIKRLSLRVYFSNSKCTLEEAENGFNIYMLGGIGNMDIFQEWYGYSEWTILGYDLIHFKLISEDGGEHDLKQIFASYSGKYAHILIDIIEI